MTKEELVIGNRYKIRRPSIADGNVNSYQWSDATLVDIFTHIAVFSVGEYCVTYKFCQLRDEVKEAYRRKELHHEYSEHIFERLRDFERTWG